MKKIVYFASILFLASSIISCQKELQDNEKSPIEKGGVTVNVVADGNLVSDEASKTAAFVDGTTTKFKWTKGDDITLYEYIDNEFYDSGISSKLEADSETAKFTVTLTKPDKDPKGESYVYSACYPAGAFTSSSDYDRYQIPSAQSLAADGNFDPAADIMFGKAGPRTERVTDATELGLRFKRLGTIVKFTLKGITSGEQINTITITAPENIAGYSKINFMTGEVGDVAYSSQSKTITLHAGKLEATGNDVVWFRCIEGIWKAGDKFSIVIDTDKAGYSREITIPEGGFEFSAGGLTKLTIGSLGDYRTEKATDKYIKVTEAPDDWSGEYLLVYESTETDAYVWTGVDAANCYAAAKISDNTISSVPTGAAILTIARMEGGYSIKVNNLDSKFVGQTSNANGMSINGTAKENTISIETETSSAKITSSGAVMRYNATSGQDRFRYFKSSTYTAQQPVQLYKLEEAPLTSIVVSGTPNKKSYVVGEEFDTDGLVVTATYADDSQKDVTAAAVWTITPETLSVGTTSVSVVATYKGVKSNAFVVDGLSVKELSSISVKTAPTKTTYTEGEKFDPTGLVITKNFSDSSAEDVAYSGNEEDFSFSPELNASLKVSDDKVTITYQGKSVEQAITVEEKQIPTFSSLDDLVAADLDSGTEVKVSFENVPIKSIFISGQYRNGIYFDIQKGGKDIEIFFWNVPEAWVAGGTVSGTMICPWKNYSGTWELAPEQGKWSWDNLTYIAPCATPKITLEGANASITCETEGATILYEISDSEPASFTQTYSRPVTLTDGQTIWAKATKAGCPDSKVTSKKYTAGGGSETKTFTIKSDDVVTNSSYAKYETVVNDRGWLITFGGNNKSVGTNSGNRSKCNLSSDSNSKYAVSPVATSDVASAFACKTKLTGVKEISYTYNGGSSPTSTEVYVIYSTDGNTFSKIQLTSGTQGSTISSGTTYKFSPCDGYFALLFKATNSSGNWRIDDVNVTFTYED